MSQQILSPDELLSLEQRAKRELGLGTLMQRAGEAVARVASDLTPEGGHVVILCGPGNNGGDGLACACALREKSYEVTVCLVGCAEPKTEEAQQFWKQWTAQGGRVITDPYMAAKADCVVDAMYGTGLKRPLRGDALDAVLWFNERQAPHIAVDVPSGLNALTGNWTGGIRGCMADVTVTMLADKAGLHMMSGADAAGRVVVDELGVSVPLSSLNVTDPSDFAHLTETRPHNSHKGTYGSVCVVGGDAGFAGAAVMAARAALRIGAGKVNLELLDPAAPSFDPCAPELMIPRTELDLSKSSCNVVGCGIGFSDRARARIAAAIDSPAPLVLDADALRILADDASLQEKILGRTAHTVITPHPGEAAAILKRTVSEIGSDRVAAARELALQTGAIAVLKGAGTVISMRSTRTWINPTGNACLATAGSGDVLAGLLGGLFAQGYDMKEAVLGAVWLHGKAAEGRLAGVTASELAQQAADELESMRCDALPAWRRLRDL